MYICVQDECLGPIEVRRGAGSPRTGVAALDYHVGADSVRGQDRPVVTVSRVQQMMCWHERNKRKLVQHSIQETEAGEL